MSAAPFNLSTLLLDDHIATGHGERPAIRYEGRTLSYADVAALGRHRACKLEVGREVAHALRCEPFRKDDAGLHRQ